MELQEGNIIMVMPTILVIDAGQLELECVAD